MSQAELPPGVQVLERGWLSSNNVLFLGAHSTALVDSGYCAHAEQTVALVPICSTASSIPICTATTAVATLRCKAAGRRCRR